MINQSGVTGSATLFIHSGVLDLPWSLPAATVSTLLQELNRLKGTRLAADPDSDSRLVYHGFGLDLTFPAAGLLMHFDIYHGRVQETDYQEQDRQAHLDKRLYLHPQKFYLDPGRTLEHTLFALAHLDPQFDPKFYYSLVKSEIDA